MEDLLQVCLLSEDAHMPCYGSTGAAGLDLFAARSITIPSDKFVWVETDVSMAIPEGYVGIVKSRSSMAGKGVYSEAGVIDADYRGHVKIHLRNETPEAVTISAGAKIAQMLLVPVLRPTIVGTSVLDATDRGEGGFGSTGA